MVNFCTFLAEEIDPGEDIAIQVMPYSMAIAFTDCLAVYFKSRSAKWLSFPETGYIPCTKSLVKSLVSLVKSGSTRLTRLL